MITSFRAVGLVRPAILSELGLLAKFTRPRAVTGLPSHGNRLAADLASFFPLGLTALSSSSPQSQYGKTLLRGSQSRRVFLQLAFVCLPFGPAGQFFIRHPPPR